MDEFVIRQRIQPLTRAVRLEREHGWRQLEEQAVARCAHDRIRVADFREVLEEDGNPAVGDVAEARVLCLEAIDQALGRIR